MLPSEAWNKDTTAAPSLETGSVAFPERVSRAENQGQCREGAQMETQISAQAPRNGVGECVSTPGQPGLGRHQQSVSEGPKARVCPPSPGTLGLAPLEL
jgi:hypothetical protein